MAEVPRRAEAAAALIQKYGDDDKSQALAAAKRLENSPAPVPQRVAFADFPQVERRSDLEPGTRTDLARERSSVRNDFYHLISQLEHMRDASGMSDSDKARAKNLAKELRQSVEYAPWWVRILSALCLGIGTMIGYKRIVTTLGERLGNVQLTPAQGAAAELVSTVLIGVSGFTGLPVSTTHVVTSGIGGTMVMSGAGLKVNMLSRILVAWLATLPLTILISASLYYLLDAPSL